MTTYQIPERNLAPLTNRIEKINKRAFRLGFAPVILAVGEPIDTAIEVGGLPTGQFRRTFPVTVTGDAPCINGWAFAATLQRVESEDGSETGLMRAIEGAVVPESFRARFGQCDHCKQDRRRSDVFVLRSIESNAHQVVGSTCLGDFLNTDDPQSFAAMAEMLAELDDLCGGAEDNEFFDGTGSGVSRFSVDDVLVKAAAIIRLDGFLSRKNAREQARRATADTLSFLFTPPVTEKDRRDHARFAVESGDESTAEAAREWARSFSGSDSDYLYNLSVTARSASLTSREFGFAAAMVMSYQREMAQRAESAMETSHHFGAIGERVTLTVTFESSRQVNNEYGLTTVCRYRTTAGNLATWFASGTPDPTLTETDNTVIVDATIKGHGEFKGVKQTTITRVKLHVEKVKKARKARALEVSVD